MKKILIVAQFTQLPGESGNNRGRFKFISEMLSHNGYDVTVITSKFRELDRTFRKKEKAFDEAPYKIVLLDEAGYSKNISFRRIYSMRTFAKNLKRYLDEYGQNFDLIYSCVPGLDSALVAGRYANRNFIPFIIDVQDVWPEVMYDLVLDIPVVSNVLFYPFQRMANEVYSLADGIIAVSKTYLNIAMRKNTKNALNDYIYIGTDIDVFDRKVNEVNTSIDIEKSGNEFWISYIGSLGHSYDICTFLEAANKVRGQGIIVQPIIIGSGPLETKFKNYASTIDSNAIFTGWVDYGTMGCYLKKSDAVINAIKGKAASITNKIGDYLSSGKPMLNGSLNEEFRKLVEEYKFGMNYEPQNADSLAEAIIRMVRLQNEERELLGRNARKLAEEKFDRKKTYLSILKMVDSL